MKFKLSFVAALFALALKLSAQVTLEGYGEVIQTAVANSFPPGIHLTAALEGIPTAIGSQGVVVTGRDINGELLGSGLTSSTTSSANFNIGAAVSTSVVWTTTIAWKPVEGADGFIHIQITVTWGSNSESYTRVIDAATRAPSGIFPPSASTPSSSSSTPSLPTQPPPGFGSGSGHYETIQMFGQYSYIDAVGTMHVVSYTYTLYVWISDGSGGNIGYN